LAPTIFKKIRESEVVVADVTLVGATLPTTAEGEGSARKKLINSNVAIELGYALHAATDEKVLLVFDTYYGGHEELPFDLRHKGGSVVFTLGPEAGKAEIADQKKELKDQLVRALKPYLTNAPLPSAPFIETPPTFRKATYFNEGQPLIQWEGKLGQKASFSFGTKSLCYLRLIPTVSSPRLLPIATLKSVAHHAPLLTRALYPQTAINEYGVVHFEPEANGLIGSVGLDASTQLFETGEIWSIRASMIRTEPEGEPPGTKYPFLPSLKFEQIYYDTLHRLTEFAIKELGQKPSWHVEMGLVGVKGVYVPVAKAVWVPIMKAEIIHRATVAQADDAALNDALLQFFSLVYDATGNVRAHGLNGFPPHRPTP
jgi:hypothetical protein